MATLQQQLETIPPSGEWWHPEGLDTFITLAEELIGKGYSAEDAVDFLQQAYWAVANEYGE